MKLDLKMYDRYSFVVDAIDSYINDLEKAIDLFTQSNDHKYLVDYYSRKLAVGLKIKEELSEV